MARLASGNEDDALDLVQDAMLDFVRRYATRPEGEWKVLFQVVLQSRIVDWHRRNAVRSRFRVWFGSKTGQQQDDEADPIMEAPDPAMTTPLDDLVRKRLAEAIERAVRSLPIRQRQAFLLRAWEGLDTAQTANAMKCSEGSVKTHYSRAIHTLRYLLEEFKP